MSLSDETLWKAVHRMEAAADRIASAASQAEEAARRFAHLLEDGYGGNGIRLIELLEEAAKEKTDGDS